MSNEQWEAHKDLYFGRWLSLMARHADYIADTPYRKIREMASSIPEGTTIKFSSLRIGASNYDKQAESR